MAIQAFTASSASSIPFAGSLIATPVRGRWRWPSSTAERFFEPGSGHEADDDPAPYDATDAEHLAPSSARSSEYDGAFVGAEDHTSASGGWIDAGGPYTDTDADDAADVHGVPDAYEDRNADDRDRDGAAPWWRTGSSGTSASASATANSSTWLMAGGALLAAGAAGVAGSGEAGAHGLTGTVQTDPPPSAPLDPPATDHPAPPNDDAALDGAAPGGPQVQLLAAGGAMVGGLPSTSQPVITVGNLEPDATWFYRVDGQDWVQGQGHEIPASVFAEQGAHLVEVRQVDLAGNEGDTASLRFWFDNIKPTVATVVLTNDSGLPGDRLTNDASLSIAGVEEGGSWIYSVDGGAWQAGQGQTLPDASLGGDGKHEVRVIALDATGNRSDIARIELTRDTQGPTAGPGVGLDNDTGSSMTDRVTNDPGLYFTDLEPGARWSISLDNGQRWLDAPAPIGPDDEAVFRDASRFDHDGDWTVLARQIDAAGNVGTGVTTFQFKLDRTPPPTPTVVLEQDSGKPDDRITNNATVRVSGLPTGDVWSYQIDGAGPWKTTADLIIPKGEFRGDGLHTVTVNFKDTAGNISAQTLNFTLDTHPPGAPSLVLSTDAPPAGI